MADSRNDAQDSPLSDDELDVVSGGVNPRPPVPPPPGQAGNRVVGTGPEGATPPPGPGSND